MRLSDPLRIHIVACDGCFSLSSPSEVDARNSSQRSRLIAARNQRARSLQRCQGPLPGRKGGPGDRYRWYEGQISAPRPEICPRYEFPCGHLRFSRKTFRVTPTFFLEIFLEICQISTQTHSKFPRTAHAGCIFFFICGAISKIINTCIGA